MTNPENKVNEYIERAKTFLKVNYPITVLPDGKISILHVLPIAQMLQREEHYQNSNNKKDL